MRKKITLALLSLLLVPLGMMAQNVTVHPGNGSMLPAKKNTTQSNGDTFFRWRGFATWKHEQLSLTMTTGDSENNLTNASNQLTGNGQLKNPANNIFATPANTTGAARYLQIGKGIDMDTYVTVVLPKGYRFTGYSITFHRINYPTADGISHIYYGNDYIQWRDNDNQNQYSQLYETTRSISFGETDNTFNYTSTTNTTTQNITSYRGGIAQNTTTPYTIGRTSKNSTDMTNVLYFKLSAGDDAYRAFIMLDKMELYFTAENNTQAVIPSTATGTGRSAIDIPFTTGKVDYDELTNRTDGVTRISYDGTIRDMNANMILYEDGSVRRDDEDNGFDGTVGKMLDYHSGSISVAGDYFQLDPSNHHFLTDDGEAIYYIESPIWAINSAAANAHKNPIGYRIVSAKFTCAPGTGGVYLPATFKIQYESEGHGPNEDGTYGLNTYSGTYNWNPSYHTVWRIDQEGYIYGYVSYDGSIRYLAYGVDQQGNNNFIMTTTKPTDVNGTFEITKNNQIRLKSNTDLYIGWKETVDGTYWWPEDDPNAQENDNVTRYFVIAEDEGHRATYNQVTAASESSSAAYTLKIYGPDGTTVAKTIDGSKGGTETVYGYNNDAIKIGVTGGTALITAEITMQALDPYIDRLRIVCEEQGGNGGKVSQQFNATDFSVKGGPFTFYVPKSFTGDAKFTFEDLYSKYGDETYYNETSSTNHARYFFVGSTYGDSYANVYDRYNKNRGADYTTKIACKKPGDKAYTFNNAATVANTGGYFEENAFSKALYASKVSGQFTDFIIPSTSTASKTAYLFTCDETRYNIAPTTATQHVYYAFYKMDIKMSRKDYTPKSIWTQVYDHTCYNNGTSTAVIDKPQYGVKLGTTVASDEGDPNGYLTVSQVKNAITTITGIVQNLGKTVTDENSKFDIDKDNDIDKDDLKKASNVDADVDAPESTEQILYIDGSELQSLVEDKQNNQEMTLDKLREGLGANALVYLPKGTTSEYSNIAYMTPTETFRGADDFELIDMRPFYAPYDITIDQEKMITYKRSITVPKNGKVTSASIILPFAIDLTNAPFTLHKMQAQNCLKSGEAGADSEVYFPNIGADQTDAQVTKAEANTPYMLKVTNPGTNDKYSFVLTQAGTTIKATPTNMVKEGDLKYTFEGETGKGAKDGKSITFVNHGTYAGKQLAYDGNYFYFSKNMFLRSNDYTYKGTVKMAPFRTFYSATGDGLAKLAAFDLIFDEGMGDTPDGISSLTRNADLMVTAGKGTITLASTIDQDVRVNSLNGMLINNACLQSGEMRTINVPSGIYVVNGVKIIVK